MTRNDGPACRRVVYQVTWSVQRISNEDTSERLVLHLESSDMRDVDVGRTTEDTKMGQTLFLTCEELHKYAVHT